MTSAHLQMIETSLGIILPETYKCAMAPFPWPAYQGSTETSLWDDPVAIINQTNAQRAGFGGAPPWPTHYVVIGDEDDACPYALDCQTGTVIWTDHGYLNENPLAKFPNVAELVANGMSVWAAAPLKPWWKIW